MAKALAFAPLFGYNEIMLVECITKLGEYRAVRMLRAFLRSPWYTVLIALLMVCANLFSLELPVFYLYLVLAFFAILFDDDLKCILPVFLGCYLAISPRNNPAVYPPKELPGWKPSAFYDPGFMLQLYFLIAAFSVLIVGRLIVILMRGNKKKVPALALGFGALGLAYLLAGAFSKYYDLRTVFFGAVQILSLSGLYFLFYYGVDWDRTRKDEFAILFTVLGFGITAEVLGLYVQTGAFGKMLAGEAIDRGILVTGWGMYNNVGCVLAICAPAPLYFAATRKHGYLYLLLGVVLLGGLLFTQSRGSILFGGIAFVFGLVAVLVTSKGRARLSNAIAIGICSALLIAVLILVFCIPAFRKKAEEIFSGIFEHGFDDNGRWEIYRAGLEQFAEGPFFGVGFYQCTAFRWGELPPDAFLPPRYHDTYVQLLASGGVFALCCYLLHRLETVVLLFRRATAEKIFIAVCISALLMSSIVDCHFFNFGPGFLYGTLLVFAEGSELRDMPQSAALRPQKAE